MIQSLRSRLRTALTAVSAALLLVVSTPGGAMWAKQTDAELVARANLIVDAELLDIADIVVEGVSRRLGVLAVSAARKGEAGKVVLLRLPSPDQPRSSSDIDYPVGARGIWFLRQESSAATGIYLADTPQSLWNFDQAERLSKALAAQRAAAR